MDSAAGVKVDGISSILRAGLEEQARVMCSLGNVRSRLLDKHGAAEALMMALKLQEKLFSIPVCEFRVFVV